MGKVAFVTINYEENGVAKAVDWEKLVNGDMFFKINAISYRPILGQCTSPLVLEAVLGVLRERFPNAELYVGDADLAATERLEKAAEIWSYRKIARKHGAAWRSSPILQLLRCSRSSLAPD